MKFSNGELNYLVIEEYSLTANYDKTYKRMAHHINKILMNGEMKLLINVRKTHFPNKSKSGIERDIKTISKHQNNALSEECKISSVAKIAIVQLWKIV